METKNAVIHRKMPMPARQLPITGFAHKTRVVGDGLMRAVLAARDMTAERRRAAVLDRRHDFQLAEAHMPGVGLTPSRTMAAEDIRDLQDRTRHEKPASGGRFGLGCASRRFLGQVQTKPLQRARHVADRVDGDAGIERRRWRRTTSAFTTKRSSGLDGRSRPTEIIRFHILIWASRSRG